MPLSRTHTHAHTLPDAVNGLKEDAKIKDAARNLLLQHHFVANLRSAGALPALHARRRAPLGFRPWGPRPATPRDQVRAYPLTRARPPRRCAGAWHAAGAIPVLMEKITANLVDVGGELDIDFNSFLLENKRKMSSIDLDTRGHVVVTDQSLRNDGAGVASHATQALVRDREGVDAWKSLYAVESEAGKGMFGIVYNVKSIDTGDSYAMKHIDLRKQKVRPWAHAAHPRVLWRPHPRLPGEGWRRQPPQSPGAGPPFFFLPTLARFGATA